MVGPIYIIAVALGLAFVMGLFGKSLKNLSEWAMLAGLGFMTFVSGQWLLEFMNNTRAVETIFTAGFKPPYSINLQMGIQEAFFTFIINVVGLLGGIYLFKDLKQTGPNAMMVFLVFVMSLNVVVMTRDMFNLFVFLEVGSIATAGLILLNNNGNALQAGMKYLIATGIISSILLVGIIYAYYFSGSLNIDDILAANLGASKVTVIAVFLIYVSVLLELKPFPANGWGIDVYTAANPGIGALVSAASASASLFVLYKLASLGGAEWLNYIAIIGGITFVGSNLIGTKQESPNRLLGYSSIGQIGLLTMIVGLSNILGEKMIFIASGILISHYAAKAGLFWLSGIINAKDIKGWAALRKSPFLLFLFGTFVFALIGFPPFPSFFGKWELIMTLATGGHWAWMVTILVGSFIEGIYLFRWLGYAIKLDHDELPDFKIEWNKIFPVWIMAIVLYAVGVYVSPLTEGGMFINYLPLMFVLFLFAIDFLPIYIKNTVSIGGIIWYMFHIYPVLENDLLRLIFAGIFLIGGVLTLMAGYNKKGTRKGFYPMAMMMYAGLIGIIESSSMLEFFFSWELMTAGSYFLIIRGKRSLPHGYSYMLFSIGGAYAILFGFGLAFASGFDTSLAALGDINILPTLAYSLLAVGFMTKTASLGLHIWLPGAHGEAESDVSPMVSAILLKAGVFGLMLLFLYMDRASAGANNLWYVLGWVGALTTLVGNMSAAFQEDAKRLLAYSSIAQLGYILFALSIMTHLGWLAGFTYTINHFLFKAILFLVVGGIVVKLGTHNMYEMGGMIKKMPFSFIAVLISIIVIGGIPPLSGFAGKWLFYNAILEKGWYFQGALIFFSGIVAFLYLYKLIHSIFLGQLKDNHRTVKEISAWILVPSYILIIGIMIFSAFPHWILKPIETMIAPYFSSQALMWDGTKALTSYGYWDGTTIMIVVGTAFVLLLTWLIVLSAKAKKIEQFNIVFAAERPFRPETTHVSYNIYAGYKKALGFVVAPGITIFWNVVSTFVLEVANWFRRIYSGNMQNYALHVVLYIVVFYLIALGGF
ncbi:MAG TPA: NADH-quinone oxidoreductase subunit F [Bacteroidales bacterium]|nr:NADH-quinone oxidoreductase subunit F [Bacteroidales bacterium]